ncbi:hypothetical protein DVJ77_06410 [Dyella tabacisoli]|uniref:Tetratricopeptide repeat protein n=2 Tax=Dyella tabacisoli TaxID=2282381 RepID=A0A369UPI0_9GAMM|nr:hypothetical protein DVJ77_06410 [Dyella tabacisoli]
MAGAGLSMLAVAVAMACGGFFPNAMFSDRVGALRGTPANTFAYEAEHLVTPDRSGTLSDADINAYGDKALALLKANVGADGDKSSAPPEAATGVAADAAEQDTAQAEDSRMQCDWRSFFNSTECAAAIVPADLKQAIALYAQQTAHGSANGVQSLRFIAGWALKDRVRVDALIDDPVAQRLLVAYALARVGDTYADDKSGDSDYLPLDAAVGAKNVKVNPQLVTLIDAIDAHGLGHSEGADRLAALAYRTGRYDLAAKMADKQTTPLASWVRAKLALQKGDLAAAGAAYADAVKAFPVQAVDLASLESDNVSLIRGERGVLAVARGEYVEAMGYIYGAAQGRASDRRDEDFGDRDYEGDVTYLAERVLTADELKSFVDKNAPANVPASADERAASLRVTLRNMLARRLMREGRYDEAMPYFAEVTPAVLLKPPFSSSAQDALTRQAAQDFAKAMKAADHAWSSTEKARQLFAAAQIAHDQGANILGYDDWHNQLHNQSLNQADGAQTYFGADESKRLEASGGVRIPHEQYMYTATDLAWRAADALPPRSQAFAATLCTASGWMIYANYYVYDAEKDRAARIHKIYRRYVKEGPYVDWAEDFGRQCEDPDFTAAESMVRAQYIAHAKHWARRALPYLAGVTVLIGLWGIMLWRRRRKVTAG